MKKILSTFAYPLLLVLFAVSCLVASPTTACASQAQTAKNAASLAKLAGKTAGVMTGTPQDEIVRANIEDAQLLYFNSLADMILALQSGKIDFICVSSVNYYILAQDYPDLAYLDCALKTYDVGTVFPQTDAGKKLQSKFNTYIASITASGELTKLQDYWLMPRDWEAIDIPESGTAGVLHMATSNTMKPFSMEVNGKPAGFDIAVVAGFCKAYGYGLQVENVDFAGALSGIATGTYDLAAGQISWTEERAQSVLFSDFYYTQKLVPIVRASDFADGEVVRATDTQGSNSANSSPSTSTTPADKSVWTSIRRTLLDQNRWFSILIGLRTTLIITLVGFAVANVLGALLCAMTFSHKRGLKLIARIYAGIMQGLPVVVILMLLYYVILAGIGLNNVAVASLGFGLIYAAGMSQLFEGSIQSVELGQWEAALASGLTKHQAFYGIILPQAARTALTGYFTNLINLMKGTAVVGYIAVTDLTQVGDIIRSATYEAFVPILTVAAIYLILTCVILACMTLVKRQLQRPRAGKAGAHA